MKHTLFIELSNIAFLLPLSVAIRGKERIASSLIFLVFVVSTVYHGYCYDSSDPWLRETLNIIDWTCSTIGLTYTIYYIWIYLSSLMYKVFFTLTIFLNLLFFFWGLNSDAIYLETHGLYHISMGLILYGILSNKKNLIFAPESLTRKL